MKDRALQRVTGFAGIAMYLTVMAVIPLFFAYDGAPPDSNVLTRVLVSMFTSATLLVFLVGFREILRRARPDHEFLAALTFHAGFAYVLLILVADSVQVGTVLAHTEPVDPTLVGSGGETSLLIWGPLSRLLTALFLSSAAASILVTRVLARWLAGLAFAISALDVVLIPTIYSGVDPTRFFSINGLGIPTAGGLFALWVLLVGVALLLRARSPATAKAR
ncbi:MAG: hypothetical protein U0132_19900 [Gemmatimonadaceae bacterium]